jgi:hypothetical protein
MAEDDVALAWVRIHDEDTRRRVTEGDLSALGELSLNPEEESLVRRLAEEGVSSEVEAFETSGFFAAMTYSYGKLSKPVLERVQAQLDEDEEVSGYGYRQAVGQIQMGPAGWSLSDRPIDELLGGSPSSGGGARYAWENVGGEFRHNCY